MVSNNRKKIIHMLNMSVGYKMANKWELTEPSLIDSCITRIYDGSYPLLTIVVNGQTRLIDMYNLNHKVLGLALQDTVELHKACERLWK